MWGFLVVFNLKAPHVLTVATILSIFFRLLLVSATLAAIPLPRAFQTFWQLPLVAQ